MPLADLAAAHGAPLYVYSRGAMQAAAAAYQRALAGRPHLLCYAMKANANLAVLKTFAELGLGFDIVSGGELARVLAIGGDPAKIVFSGVGKTRVEMAAALRTGVRCFNVEREAELHPLSEVASGLAATAAVSLHVNPDVDARTHPYISTGLKGNKFGVAHADAGRVYQLAASLPGLKVTGIDCHIGSKITEIAPYLDALDRLLDLIEQVEAMGITYTDEQPPAADVLVGQLLARIDARGHGHREILMEPGRSLVGNVGVLLTEVLVLKPGAEKNFCSVDAAMNDLMRPALYQAWMAIEPCHLREQRDRAPLTWDVVGPVCESGEWLGRDRPLALRAGDTLAVLSAGAYGMPMASNYNTRPRAAELMVDGGRATLIRRRETVDELFRNELF